jgi:hypothetical protein
MITTDMMQTGYNLFISLIGYVAPLSIVIAVSMKLVHIGIRAITGKM